MNFIKRGNYQSESFFIESNQCKLLFVKGYRFLLREEKILQLVLVADVVTSIHESWFCGRCMNTSKPAGEGAIVYKTPSFLFVAL